MGTLYPFSIYKSYKSKSNDGKSLWFLLIALSGYMFCIIHKIFYNYDSVIFLYIFNFIMIFADSCLYLRNRIISNKKSY
ncbi:PQ-loop domain-containing transporter [Candidatus Endomicrobiellum trichonymphae]|uniref:PQ-loop domain-containing transporter n=1 Tax=Endomicrobium trichonymphae TaxID=1408204 RepID=UPI0018D4F9C9